MARPYLRTTIRITPELEKAAQKHARRRGETFSAMLRRYIVQGMEGDGVKFEMTVAAPAEAIDCAGALDL